MGLSFRLTAVKELKKKKKKKKKLEVGRARRCRRAPAVSILQILPEDLLTEILLRLPAKSLMRFKCVSKLWSSLISSRCFTNIFLNTRQQRRLFMHLVNKENHSEFALLSSSPNIPDSDRAAVSVLKRDLNMPWMLGGEFVSALRGLLCVRVQGRLLICNLTTKQLVELPTIRRTTRLVDNNVWDYFCHDPVHDEYKALNVVWEESKEEEGKVISSEHHVLVLGPGVSWRRIQSSSSAIPPHRPCSQGISINGVLYYGACIDINSNTSVVMSFHLRSEEFTLIKLPLDVMTTSSPNLMNYRGKIAVFEYSISLLATNGTMDLWTLEDGAKSIWSNKMSLVLPVSEIDFASDNHLMMQSTTRSGEVRLAKATILCNQHVFYVTYDFEWNKITARFKFNPLSASIGTCLRTNFWHDTESIMYLET
ncbi:putative F-box protein [Hirschfeldia incana]|nr:putative F-box protein [Hirschfeldia incana]